jgi:hypothetical protein
MKIPRSVRGGASVHGNRRYVELEFETGESAQNVASLTSLRMSSAMIAAAARRYQTKTS